MPAAAAKRLPPCTDAERVVGGEALPPLKATLKALPPWREVAGDGLGDGPAMPWRPALSAK